MFDLRTSVLRFWETEFKALNPRRNNKKRLYTKEDILFINQLYMLLKKESYTIEGAKKALENKKSQSAQKMIAKLTKIKEKLLKIKDEFE